jgi:hypothetical protein
LLPVRVSHAENAPVLLTARTPDRCHGTGERPRSERLLENPVERVELRVSHTAKTHTSGLRCTAGTNRPR